jgi:uncharacterized phage protein (TIGR01671 family)
VDLNIQSCDMQAMSQSDERKGEKMKEIKFRAWHDDKKEMLPPWSIWKTNLVDYDDSCYLHIMQYTGIKDKNDKEIYEGDIVLWFEGPPERSEMGIIIWGGNWDYAAFGIETHRPLFPNNDLSTWDCLNPSWGDILEVIGNKYQNPEMMEGI